MRYLIIVLFFCSCSAQWHLKKAIQKDPDLLKVNKVIIDTVIVTDSFNNIDTFTLNEIDTFITDTGKIKVTLIKFKNKYTLKTELKHDTIKIEKEIQCPPSVIQVIDSEKMKNNMLYSFLSGALITLILLIIYYGQKLENTK
jgi:hypothetical protein